MSATLPLPSEYNPVADSAAVFTRGDFRITILTARLVRFEHASGAAFEDRSTFAVVNRRLPVPPFEVREDGDTVEIETESLRIVWKRDGVPFGGGNLRIAARDGSFAGEWTPGMADPGNLRGTARTLDDVSGAAPLEPGVLSRSGWSVVDDAGTLALERDGWFSPRSAGAQDFYFFGYGKDYAAWLAAWAAIAGRAPMPPRYVFGYWWSRYWAYSDAELRALVAEHRAHDVPLDVLVVDMDWHEEGWTGYSWNRALFPDPKGFLSWAHAEGLRVTLNLHPADGVNAHEGCFDAMRRAMELDPRRTEHIPFQPTVRRFMDAYFRVLHHPLEEMGVDFWWLDWQQGTDTGTKGLDPLRWLNWQHWRDQEAREEATGRRPLNFSRWGGLGGHRWPIGFSGDVHSNWQSLAFQIPFTAVAGNVGYGYWSHDIGGHQPGAVDAELYLRWVQWGALSPVLRTHGTKNPNAERRLWAFGEPHSAAMMEAVRRRYALLPYLYTAARMNFDTLLPLCRPMYLHWPERDEAYAWPTQYMLGADLLVAPVVEPSNPATGCATREVWLPPGYWVSLLTGAVYLGDCVVSESVPLEETLVFARGGAVVPMAPGARHTADAAKGTLEWHVFPGAGDGVGEVYEDDGLSPAYLRGECARIRVRFALDREGTALRLEVSAVEGTYAGMPTTRRDTIVLRDRLPIAEVKIDGAPAPAGSVSYDPKLLAVRIALPERDAGKAVVVEATLQPVGREMVLRNGLRGRLDMVERAGAAMGESRAWELEALRTARRQLPQEQEEFFASMAGEGPWKRLARAVLDAMAEPAATVRALHALIGLSPRVQLLGNAEGELEALASLTLREVLPELRGVLTIERPEGWRQTHERQFADRLPGGGATLSVHKKFQPGTVPQTTRLRTEFRILRGTHAIPLMMERTIAPSIGAWWIVGPFANPWEDGLHRVHPPEQAIDFSASYPGAEGSTARWRRIVRAIDPQARVEEEFHVDLCLHFGRRYEYAVAYALATIHASEPREVTLAIGSDDGVAVRLNGAWIHRNHVGRSYTSRQDRVRAQLLAGPNELLLKISQGLATWNFAAHLEDEDGRPVTGLRVE